MARIDRVSVQQDAHSMTPEVYQALWKYTTDLISIIDATGIMRYVSPSYEQTLGFSPSELVGTNSFDRIHPEDVDAVWHAFVGLRGHPGATARATFRYRHKDGSWRVIEATGANHLDDPVVSGFVINSRDVTERLRAEDRLQEQEEQYRSVFQATSEAMAIVDMNGYVVEANDATCRLHGYSYEEIIGLHISALTHPEQHDTIEPGIRDIEDGGTAPNLVLALRKDGSTFWAETHGTAFTYAGVPHILAMARDVTERVYAEAQLREREAQYRTIFESSSDGLIINDPHTGTVVEANPAVCQMHGYTYDEFIGLHATAFIHPDDHPVFAEFRTTIESGGTYQTQAIDVRKDGTSFPFEVHGSSVIYQGKPHILAVVRDITQRVQAEQAVLEERQRLSRELHDSVSQALYSIGLGAGTARAMLETDPQAAAEPIEFTVMQAERGLAEMRALIFELRPETIELEGLVATLQKQANAVNVRHHVRVDTEFCEEPDVPLPLKEALYRVAQEAMHNATKHAAARTIRVSLRVAGDHIELLVEDDGRGFDPTEAFPGHLGLQSMRERAVQLGGMLEIRSTPGYGTKIVTVIPHPGRRSQT